ncbi:MAG: helix-turn-helix domain-containing protein [Paludibacter sp.]
MLLNIEKIELLINERGWSNTYFCKLLDKSRSWLTDMKRGKGLPDENTLALIADKLDTTSDYLLDKTDIKNKPDTENSNELTEKEISMVKQYRALPPEIQAAIDRLTEVK